MMAGKMLVHLFCFLFFYREKSNRIYNIKNRMYKNVHNRNDFVLTQVRGPGHEFLLQGSKPSNSLLFWLLLAVDILSVWHETDSRSHYWKNVVPWPWLPYNASWIIESQVCHQCSLGAFGITTQRKNIQWRDNSSRRFECISKLPSVTSKLLTKLDTDLLQINPKKLNK